MFLPLLVRFEYLCCVTQWSFYSTRYFYKVFLLYLIKHSLSVTPTQMQSSFQECSTWEEEYKNNLKLTY